MSSALDKNVPVSQPYYQKVNAGSTEAPILISEKPMYTWMAVRAAGPNVLADTSLLGDTTINGFINSNDKVGTQPAGQAGPTQNDPDSQGDPQTSERFVWDYYYRIISVRNNPYSPFGASDIPYAGIYNRNLQALYCNIESVSEPIDALTDTGEIIFGATQVNLHLKISGQIQMVESKQDSPDSAFQPLGVEVPPGSGTYVTDYMDTGYIILQPNFNKYAQLNQFSLIYTASSNIISGTFNPPDGSPAQEFVQPGSDVISTFCNYTTTGGAEDGIITIAFAYRKPTAPYEVYSPSEYYSLDVVADIVMVVNDTSPTNVAP